jgi:ribosomal protein S17
MAKVEITAAWSATRCDKSIVVTTERKVRDGVYGKEQKLTSRFMAHDENNEAQIGDTRRPGAVASAQPPQALVARARRPQSEERLGACHAANAIDSRRGR